MLSLAWGQFGLAWHCIISVRGNHHFDHFVVLHFEQENKFIRINVGFYRP